MKIGSSGKPFTDKNGKFDKEKFFIYKQFSPVLTSLSRDGYGVEIVKKHVGDGGVPGLARAIRWRFICLDTQEIETLEKPHDQRREGLFKRHCAGLVGSVSCGVWR